MATVFFCQYLAQSVAKRRHCLQGQIEISLILPNSQLSDTFHAACGHAKTYDEIKPKLDRKVRVQMEKILEAPPAINVTLGLLIKIPLMAKRIYDELYH